MYPTCILRPTNLSPGRRIKNQSVFRNKKKKKEKRKKEKKRKEKKRKEKKRKKEKKRNEQPKKFDSFHYHHK